MCEEFTRGSGSIKGKTSKIRYSEGRFYTTKIVIPSTLRKIQSDNMNIQSSVLIAPQNIIQLIISNVISNIMLLISE